MKKDFLQTTDSEQNAIFDKFESDCMNAPNFAEGLRIAFDNLPDNFLK